MTLTELQKRFENARESKKLGLDLNILSDGNYANPKTADFFTCFDSGLTSAKSIP
jgi:hypothetical protein